MPPRFLNRLSSLQFLRMRSLCWGGCFFFTPYPKEHMVIKTINAAFLWLFLLVVNYDNGIHTQMHTCTQGSHLSAGLKSALFYAKSIIFPQRAKSQLICTRR